MLFGESAGRIVVSVKRDLCGLFESELGAVPAVKLGSVCASGEITIDGAGWGYLPEWKEAYDTALEKLLG